MKRSLNAGFWGVVISFHCALAPGLAARPRPPLPPFPELAPLVFRADFDEPFWTRKVKPVALHPAYADLVESWSGYALRRAGKGVTPFLVPALDELGRTNISTAAGAVRFWFQPEWASASFAQGGGPGAEARLVELSVVGEKDALPVWSLDVSPDGTMVVLTGAGDDGPAVLLQAEINWPAGRWHLVTLNYGPKGTALFIDGELAAEGGGTLAVPASVGVLSIGSTLTGDAPVQGEFDEVCAFARPLPAALGQFYYGAFSQRTALGRVTAEEETAQRDLAQKRKAEREAEGGTQQYRMMQSLTNCPTNALVWLTNVSSLFITNQGITVTFDVTGGTNGYLYDIFTTTNLAGTNIANTLWTWLEQGPTCARCTYTNQPAGFAFFVVGTPLDTDSDGLTDAYELLVSKTSTSATDTDQDGVSDYDEVLQGRNPIQPPPPSPYNGWRADGQPQKVRLETLAPRR